MCAQIFLVISVRGSASVPTILARCSEGCTGFINALFEALGDVFAIFDLHSYLRFEIRDHRIVMDQAADVRTQKFSLKFHLPTRTWTLDGAIHSGDVMLFRRRPLLELNMGSASPRCAPSEGRTLQSNWRIAPECAPCRRGAPSWRCRVPSRDAAPARLEPPFR
jgi:hypothetical protein